MDQTIQNRANYSRMLAEVWLRVARQAGTEQTRRHFEAIADWYRETAEVLVASRFNKVS
jgi:hypothetical protein